MFVFLCVCRQVAMLSIARVLMCHRIGKAQETKKGRKQENAGIHRKTTGNTQETNTAKRRNAQEQKQEKNRNTQETTGEQQGKNRNKT